MSGGLSEQAMGVVCVGCEYGHGAEQRPGGVPTDSAGRQFVYLAGEWRCPDCVQRAWDLATAEADAAEERADRAERALADAFRAGMEWERQTALSPRPQLSDEEILARLEAGE